MVALLAAPPPAASVAARRRETTRRQLDRQVVRDPDRPGAAADGDVPAGIDEARARGGEDLARAVGGVPLRNAPEVEPGARLERDRRAANLDLAAAAGGCAIAARPVGLELVEGSVVARGSDRVVNGGVEAPCRALACRESQRGDPDEIRAAVEAAGAVQTRQLGFAPEAGEQPFQAMDFRLRGDERRLGGDAGRWSSSSSTSVPIARKVR